MTRKALVVASVNATLDVGKISGKSNVILHIGSAAAFYPR